ncbi:MAG: hypothetical protein WCT04_27965 [Planctomycetota bacterium]
MVSNVRPGRFQFHLSTAIFMMIVSGILIWVNLIERTTGMRRNYAAWGDPQFSIAKNYGWPFTGVASRFDYFLWSAKEQDARISTEIDGPNTEIFWSNIVLNVVVAAIILYMLNSICERSIRRQMELESTR